MFSMKTAIYIHGFGGSANGSSSLNIRRLLDGKYNLVSRTLDLTNVADTCEKINKMIFEVKPDLVISSSLGGFFAISLKETIPCILLNPCLNPRKEIPKLDSTISKNTLMDWQFMEESWLAMQDDVKAMKFGVFAKDDELFHYKDFFDANFGNGQNSVLVEGTHELAKNEKFLKDAFEYVFSWLNKDDEKKSTSFFRRTQILKHHLKFQMQG